MSNIAIKYRLYPTAEQKIMFAKTFGCCRKVWNLMLSDKIENYKTTKSFGMFTPAKYKKIKEYAYLKEVDSLALANVQLNLQSAFKSCFDKKRKKRNGFPKFKSRRKSRSSYTTNNQKGTVAIIDNKYVRLPKIGKVKATIHRIPEDDWSLKSATVSMEKDGTYYVSVLFEYENIPVSFIEATEDNTVGLDYKSDGLYVDSNGNKADIETKWYRKAQKRRTRQQRNLSRKIRSHIIGYDGNKPVFDKPMSDCKNIQKNRKRLAKMERKVSNQRKDALHKESTKITNSYDFVCVETLNMKSLSNKGFGNGKATMDNGYGMFLSMLEYKLERKGGSLIKVEWNYPSSQLCDCCGFQYPFTKDLTVRDWTCPNCGDSHDRDINAAKNIKKRGLEILKENQTSMMQKIG